MTDNPYQSPASLDLVDLNSAELDPRDRRGRSLWVMTPAGLFFGSMVIAIAGALGGGSLGLIFMIASPPDRGQFDEVVMVMAMVGGLFGAVGGAVIGAVAGLVAGLSRMRMRKGYVSTTALVTGLYGCIVGLLAGFALSQIGRHSAWLAIGGMIGAMAGLGGGWVLAESMARLCWNHLMKKRLPPIPARLQGQ